MDDPSPLAPSTASDDRNATAIEEVKGLVADQVLILGVAKTLPAFARVTSEDIVETRVQLAIVLVQIIVQILRAKHLCNAHQLIIVVMAMEKGFLAKDHRCEHASKGPHVQRVIVELIVHE